MQERRGIDGQRRGVRAVLAAVAAATMLVMVGCSAGPVRDDATNGAETGLEQYREQDLDFGECDPSIAASLPPVPEVAAVMDQAECAMLVVPLDYAKPDGETIEVATLRVAAEGESPIGSVVVNPGGPGSPGTSFAPLLAALWKGGPVTESFDVVGFDPRGVGLSRPAVDCFTDEQRDADQFTSPFGSSGVGLTEAQTQDIVEQCAAGSGGEQMLAHLGTRDAARDMDVLRAALGDEKLTYAGVSYGTRLGAVYAEMFPENVRALVLDGAMDPLKNTRERRVQLAASVNSTFEKFAAFCATQADCPLGDDPTKAATIAQGLLQPLTAEPMHTADGREVSFIQAAEGILAGLYTEASWPAIIEGIAMLRDGSVDGLLALRDAYNGRSAAGEYSNDLEANLAINCMDEERLTTEEATDLVRDLNAAAPILDSGIDYETHYGCEDWPAEPTLGFPYANDIEGLPQVLVASVTDDAVAPHEGAINLAEALGARLLTVEGAQHGSIGFRNACVDEIVAAYLVDLELPEEGVRCAI